ncbi:site-specific integrase [Streptococcus acidominimus]|uniref:Putative phage integrase n=1 Tax=Streptococcus acidominimus TaxID=1326 RepID=A0A1Q8ECW0_STRAI|nr:site-specific integrase [Streptococcus acidominimus]OLF49629.1 site-specific integrase [Streptococcus acidominimus]SUN08232.1 putative phage integrase [Streptococcus acidominimus]
MIKKYTLKDGSVRYMYHAYMGIDERTGKPKKACKRGFKTAKEARLAESQLLLKVKELGLEDSPKRIKFEDVYELWLAHYRNTVKESTFVRQKAQAELHILPIFGKYLVDKISVQFCQQQINKWFDGYVKYANFMGMTKSILDYAINQGYITDNPMKKIIKPRRKAIIDEEENKERNFYNKTELQEFLECTQKEDEELAVIFRLLAYTGLRKSELMALRWKDTDISHSSLSVNQTIVYGENNQMIFQTPKTRKSKRVIALDSVTVQSLKKWKLKKQKEIFPKRLKDEDLLFTKLDGTPHSFDFINYHLRTILNKYNLKKITPHGFRHTHCSLLFEAGATIKEVQERLGHEDIKTTMNIYAHVSEQAKEETAQKFAQYMSF